MAFNDAAHAVSVEHLRKAPFVLILHMRHSTAAHRDTATSGAEPAPARVKLGAPQIHATKLESETPLALAAALHIHAAPACSIRSGSSLSHAQHTQRKCCPSRSPPTHGLRLDVSDTPETPLMYEM